MKRFAWLAALVSLLAVLLAATPARAGVADAKPKPSPGGSSSFTVVSIPDQVYGTTDPSIQTFDAYLPVDSQPLHPAIVLIHGGGWTSGDKSQLAVEANYFAQNGFAAFSIDYRLAPESPFPAAVLDVKAAVSYIRARALAYQVDANNIGALGASAGAELASLLATQTDGNPASGSGVRSAVSWSSPMDMALAIELGGPAVKAGITKYLNCRSLKKCTGALTASSPITWVGPGDANLLFFHSTDEFVPVETAREMNDAMNAGGLPHTYIEMPGSRHASNYEDSVVPGTSITVLQYCLNFFDATL